jgi:hypothetical protein
MEKDEQKIIQLWKELQITHIDFEFTCGGDSMNDTTLNIHKGEEIIENDTISTYFDNEVYNAVEFYVNSDGHYMGESGNVLIELEDDEFIYSKSAEEEWCERVTNEVEIELTDEEVKFVEEFVSNINGSEGEGININYKKDFIINEKREELIESIEEKISDFCDNYVPEEAGGELNDWYSYNTNEDTDSELVIKDNNIIVNISNEYYNYRESEN